jgi:hypothetical protein
VTTFTWKDTLTVSVGESSRTQAIDCARAFDALAQVMTSYDELMAETNVLGVLHAPSTVRFKGEVLGVGERTILIEGEEPFKLSLPLTPETFNALPMSLTAAWIDAMVRSNGWLIDTLKKALSLTSLNESEPKSGSAPLSEPTAEPQTMTTPGV